MSLRVLLRVAASVVLVLSSAVGPTSAEEKTSTFEVQRTHGKVFAQRDGRELLADIYQPAAEGTFPGVLMIHGGGWMSGNRWNMLLHANSVARAGYVVVNIEYRLAPRDKYPAQLDDCLDAYRWMCANAAELHIDPQQMSIYGYSAGAHLACLVGLNTPDESDLLRPKAIVAGGTPADFDWIAEDSMALAYFLGGSRAQLPDLYRDASPITHVTTDDPPVFLFHGEQDSVVPIESAERLYKRLQQTGVESQLVKIADQGHVAAFLDPESPQRAIQFLNSVFRDDEEGERDEGHDQTSPSPAAQPETTRTPNDNRP